MKALKSLYSSVVENEKQHKELLSQLEVGLETFQELLEKSFSKFDSNFSEVPFDVAYNDGEISILFSGYDFGFGSSHTLKTVDGTMTFNVEFNGEATDRDVDALSLALGEVLGVAVVY